MTDFYSINILAFLQGIFYKKELRQKSFGMLRAQFETEDLKKGEEICYNLK